MQKYRWECHHDTYSGKDRECCDQKGNWTDLDTAIRKGKIHNESHRWTGWGYAPLGWKNQTVNIMEKGKEIPKVMYNEL